MKNASKIQVIIPLPTKLGGGGGGTGSTTAFCLFAEKWFLHDNSISF